MATLVRSPSTADWLALRKTGIGGSDIAAICGHNKYKGAYDIWLQKTGLATEEQEQSQSAYFGSLLEETVAKEFQKRTGMKVQRINGTIIDGIRIANVDRFIVNPAISRNVRWFNGAVTTDTLLECKTAGAYTAGRWGESQENLILKGLPCPPAQMPLEYLCQVQWYLGITGCQTAYLAVLIGGQDFRIYRIERDQDAIDWLFEKADRFWVANVMAEQPPEPTNAAEADTIWNKDNGSTIEADNATAAAYGDLISLKAQKRQIEDQIEEKETILKLHMRDNQVLTINGDKAATWKTGERSTIDTKALRSDLPDIAEKYTRKTQTRTLRTY